MSRSRAVVSRRSRIAVSRRSRIAVCHARGSRCVTIEDRGSRCVTLEDRGVSRLRIEDRDVPRSRIAVSRTITSDRNFVQYGVPYISYILMYTLGWAFSIHKCSWCNVLYLLEGVKASEN